MTQYTTDIADSGAQPGPGGYAPEGAPGVSFLDRLRSVRLEGRPGVKEVYEFTSQLAVMIQAGIKIRDAMISITDQPWANRKFQRALMSIRTAVEAGEALSASLAEHPRLFDVAYVNMIRAAELSGSFGDVLGRLAEHIEQQIETRSMVRGAMIYPAIIFVMAMVTTIFCLTFVLPRFGAMFEGKTHLLPATTKILLGISHFLRTYWYAVAGGGLAVVLGFRWVIQTPWGKAGWDRLKLRMPVIRGMTQALYITMSLRTLGELVTAGVPILDSLGVTADSSHNSVYKRMWQNVHDDVKTGDKIAASLRRQSLMPESVIQMAGVGEDSGTLGNVLGVVATFYAKRLRTAIKAVTGLLEPLMIVAMGVIVGFIAISIILPVFKLSKLNK